MTNRKPAFVLKENIHVESVDDGARVCPSCNDRKPLTRAHWNRDPHGPDGEWHWQCKHCKHKSQVESLRKAELRELALVKRQVLNQMMASADNVGAHPTRAEMAQQLISSWGTETTVMQDLVADYRVSKPGSPQRQKYMALIIQVLDRAADEAPTKRAEDMSEDELQAAIMSLFQLQQKKEQDGAIRATSSTPNPVG